MLNEKQQKVSKELEGNTIVSASPGTGKTKALVARAVKKLITLPSHCSLALITYTNAAADEIDNRMNCDSTVVFVGTIHRFCLEYILRPFSWIYDWDKPQIMGYEAIKAFIADNTQLDLGSNAVEELPKIKRLLDGSLDLNVDWKGSTSLTVVADAYYSFQESKQLIDFNEVLYRSYKLIASNSYIATSLANKFYEISVDEFQDTNIFQYEILKHIYRAGRCTFFFVGDERQKLYRFAGAINNAFEQAAKDFSATIEILDVTYRSTNNIVKAFSTIYDNHPLMINESEFKSRNIPINIQKCDYDDNTDRIKCIVDKLVNELHIGYSQIAILTNTWRDAFTICKSLRSSFNLVGLGALPHKKSGTSTFDLLRGLCRYCVEEKSSNIRSIRRSIENHILENGIICEESDLIRIQNRLITEFLTLDKQQPLQPSLIMVKGIFDRIFKINHSVIDELLEQIDDIEIQNWIFSKYICVVSGFNGITVSTIHQSKGLEYDIVILSGVNEGSIPYQRWNGVLKRRELLSTENLEDGKAKIYVGISRAKQLLVIIHNKYPSLFIKVIKESMA